MSVEAANAFISRWSTAGPSERSNSQLFLSELCDLLGVPHPDPVPDNGYSFEFQVTQYHPDGTSSRGLIDLYKRGCFVLESKQFQAVKAKATQLELAAQDAGLRVRESRQPVRGSEAWDDAMIRARGQAERYVRSLPASEPNPPFLLAVDVGHTIEVFADFSQAGKAYLPFPDPRTFRIRLEQLVDEKICERLKLIWTDPGSLDPSRHSADVTMAVSGHLAELAKSLEADGHKPRVVADFLTRCLFCMFAEDVGLLPEGSFTDLLKSISEDGTGFQELLEQLFRELDTGTGKGISVVLRKKLLRFNGGLFSDYSALPVNRAQLFLLKAAALQNWRNVEPAIFGTLLERALNPRERHKLGAHYTPRAYVERLVLPTVVEPLRAEWESVRAAAITHARAGDLKSARAEVNAFHDHLCQVKVLDPACGSGNFLYVALEHLKRLEGEVLDVAASFGESFRLELGKAHSVDPHQFLGIEINPRAAAITELVLWIGYLQWHFRTRGHKQMPEEPILKKFNNIECRDAVLTYDGEPEPAKDGVGKVITVWDRHSMKADRVTGCEVPDETKRVPLLKYQNPRPAGWPRANFVVGNPPFLGKLKVRQELGDGYAQALRETYPQLPESVDFVLYWWYRAAQLARAKEIQRFGLITTNSISQTFSRRVTDAQLRSIPRLSLVLAVPDHPWVDTKDGAAVRIAMTVGTEGAHLGEVLETVKEQPQEDGSCTVSFTSRQGDIQADLTVGADVSSTISLKSNQLLAGTGLILGGRGFVLTPEKAKEIAARNSKAAQLIFPLRNGEDVNNALRNLFVIDTHGLSEQELRLTFPEIYQRLRDTVYPERQSNRDPRLQKQWWLFRRSNEQVRGAIAGLSRYIVTVETSKHRTFSFLQAQAKPEHKLVVIGTDDSYILGVLSSTIHLAYALAAGGWLGVGNDPVYSKSRCFDPFPFPACDETIEDRIRKIGEELDAHRKRVQAQHPDLTLTGMYNVLEKLRANEPLTDKD